MDGGGEEEEKQKVRRRYGYGKKDQRQVPSHAPGAGRSAAQPQDIRRGIHTTSWTSGERARARSRPGRKMSMALGAHSREQPRQTLGALRHCQAPAGRRRVPRSRGGCAARVTRCASREAPGSSPGFERIRRRLPIDARLQKLAFILPGVATHSSQNPKCPSTLRFFGHSAPPSLTIKRCVIAPLRTLSFSHLDTRAHDRRRAAERPLCYREPPRYQA